MQANNTPRIIESKINSIKTARIWIAKGISPIPLKPGSKRPRGGKGWNKRSIPQERLGEFFNKNDNVGGLWGRASNWLVDVDLDLDEACKLAPLILPETFVYGRANRPCSHFIYRSVGIKTCKFRTAGLGTIVEIRSTGTQTVLPPSLHPEGDRYQIDNDAEFEEIRKSSLHNKVSELAAATVFVKRYPEKGARHDYIHAVTGALLREGWKTDRLIPFMEAILSVVETEDDIDQRKRTVQNTIEQFRKKGQVYAWTTLQTWIPHDEQTALRMWLGIIREVKIISIPTKKAKGEATVVQTRGFKQEWLNVPGIVGDLMAVSKRMAIYNQPLFNLSAGLLGMALMSGNRYMVEGLVTPLQPYIMMLAPSSGGKNSALSSVLLMARRMDLQQHVFQGFQSYHSMLDHLAQPPNIALWAWDEAARKLKSAQHANSADYQMLTHVTELYGASKDYIPGMPGRKNPIPELVHPYLIILAAAQPKPLTEAITQGDIQTGLLSRFVLFDASDSVPEFNYDSKVLFPSKIDDYHTKIKSLPLPGGTFPFLSVRFEKDRSSELFKAFREFSHTKSYAEESPLWGRANQNALIFAGLVAIGVDCKNPKITEDIAQWAIDIITWSCECWEHRMSKSGSENKVEANSKKVEETIMKARTLATRTRYRTVQKKVLASGWMPRSILIQECRSIQRREMDDILEQLEEMELIESGTPHDQRMTVYRAKTS